MVSEPSRVGGGGYVRAVPGPLTLRTVEAAVRASWGPDVCEDPADLPLWSPANPARGQCGPTALVVNDLLGGDLCVAEVRLADGSQRGFHWWNRLAGTDIDLTREQFGPDEFVQEPRVMPRPPGRLLRGEVQYRLLRSRVMARLS
jgi:hypothetical protein